MDISRLLSPSPNLPLAVQAPPHKRNRYAACVDTSNARGKAVESKGANSASPRGQQSVQSRRIASKAVVQTLSPRLKRAAMDLEKKIQPRFVPVKRKRKRRFSAQQKQVMCENQQDESRRYNLTLDVNELKRQVQDLLMRKNIHETRALAQKKVLEARALVTKRLFNAAVLRTTQRFFEIFRNGFREWEPEEDAFFAATIDQDISIASGVRGAVRGADAFFEQWRKHTKLLQVRSISPSSTHILVSDAESCVVECKGEVEGTFMLAAIKELFPHVLQIPELLSKVVDCHLVCPTRTLLYFNDSGRIVQYDTSIDMFAGLNRVRVTSPMDVIRLMSNARISPEGGLIPDLDDEHTKKIDDADSAMLNAKAQESGSTTASSLASASPSRSGCSSRSSLEYILS